MALSQVQWPLTLPQRPLQQEYETSPGWDVVTSEFDSGLPRQRKQSSAALAERKVTYVITGAQKQELDAFIDMVQGRSFWWPDPGENMIYRYVRIKDKPVTSSQGPDIWTTELVLAVWPYVVKADED